MYCNREYRYICEKGKDLGVFLCVSVQLNDMSAMSDVIYEHLKRGCCIALSFNHAVLSLLILWSGSFDVPYCVIRYSK